MKQFSSFGTLPQLLLSFSLLAIASSLTYPSFNGYQAFELSSNSTESFNLEAQTWTFSRALTPNITTICGNTILLGGYGVLAYEGYFEKTYSSLPSHNSIYYQIQVLIIDNWSSTDSLILQFDGVNRTFSWDVTQIVARTATATNVCGQSNAKDLQYLTLMGGIAHTSGTLKFRIISKVNQSPLQASFGVRNISITVSQRDPTDMCYRSGDNIATGAPGECPCTIHWYPKDLSPLECEACDPSCLDCFDSNPDECTQCLPGYSYTSSKKCVKCASSCATCTGTGSNQCTTCAPGYWLQADGTCTASCSLPSGYSQQVGDFKVCQTACNAGQYMYANGTCRSSCPAPYVGQTINSNLICKLCANDNDFYYQWNETCGATCPEPLVTNGQLCQLPCDIDEFYFISNGTCGSTCSSPFMVSVALDVVKQCDILCDSGEYLLWNGTCESSCPAPYVGVINNNGLICKLCSNDNDFFYGWNDTCGSTCPEPLVTNGQLCQLPCDIDEFYFISNGTCGSTCSSPFMVSVALDVVKQCQSPCNINEYVLWNGSCIGRCDAPWKSELINGVETCSPPCADGEFLEGDSSLCLSECNLPFIIQTKDSILTCINPQQENSTTETGMETSSTSSGSELSQNFVESTNDITDTTGKLTSVGTFMTSLLSSSTPSGITLTVLVKMLKYILYMKVNYPPLLELMLEDQAKSPISLEIGFEMPKSLQKKFDRKTLPEKFEKYHVPSNFIVNCWQELLAMGLVILVMLLAILISRLMKRHKHIGSLFKRVSKATRWNFFLLIVCSNLIEIGLFSCLQMRSISFVSFGEGFGLILSLFMSSFSLFVLIQAFYIPRQLGKNGQKWENWSILYKEFKSHNFFQQSYMFFFLLRIVIFDILLGCLYSYPLVQAAILSVMSIAMLCYISICRPFKEKFYLIKSLVEESIVAFVNICVLILAIMDKVDYENQAARVKLGDVVILINFAFNIIALTFAFIEISIRVYGIYQLVKTEKTRGLKFWKKVILVLIEPEGLEGSQKTHAKKIGSARKVYPSNQTPKKLSHNSSISENLNFTGSLIDNTSSRNILGSRHNSKNLLLHSLSPSNNSDDVEAGNAEFKEEEITSKKNFGESSLFVQVESGWAMNQENLRDKSHFMSV